MALLDVSSTFREVEFIIEKVVKKLSRQQEYFVDRLSRHVFLVRSSSSKRISPDHQHTSSGVIAFTLKYPFKQSPRGYRGSVEIRYHVKSFTLSIARRHSEGAARAQ